MLAYLFWHWPRNGHRYEADVIAFHRMLRDAAPAGLIANASYWVESLPWLGVRSVYEDWYLVEGFADLDTLNHAAVAPPLDTVHSRVARAAADGTGGLYEIVRGTPQMDCETASWLSKPRDQSYGQFLAGLPLDICLLQRQLSLGPGPEFCALADLPGLTTAHRSRLC